MNAERLQRIWYGKDRPGLTLRALERVYARVSAAQRRRASARAPEFLKGKPIIVVGNLTAGGTGKTPLVIRLVELCQQAGIRAAVISRGYGRKSSEALQVNSDTPPDQAGDEPVLIKRSTGATVFVDANREDAARAAFAAGCELVIADDGLQRLSLPRELEICVVDGQRGFGNGRQLPAGPLREPLTRLGSVDYVVCNGEPDAGIPFPSCTTMHLEAETFERLSGEGRLSPESFLGQVRDREVHALAGIGNPERFFEALRCLDLKLSETHAFPDHHSYTDADFDGLEGVIVMTSKDAVKCRDLALENAWMLKVNARLPEAWENEIMGRIAILIRDTHP